jgi:hypothetical protein
VYSCFRVVEPKSSQPGHLLPKKRVNSTAACAGTKSNVIREAARIIFVQLKLEADATVKREELESIWIRKYDEWHMCMEDRTQNRTHVVSSIRSHLELSRDIRTVKTTFALGKHPKL